MTDQPAAAGHVLELDVGPPAHGGACVSRSEGRVVFVRHALPGERVRAVVTDDRGTYLRADAVEVVTPAPGRVQAPCPHARPGRCGGCDWQHASADVQLALKQSVVREQFQRLAKVVLPAEFHVEALPGGLLGWRTRITYAVGADGRLGLHRFHSHDVEPIDACPLGAPGVGDAPALIDTWHGVTGVEVARGDDGALAVLTHRPGPGRQARGRRPPDRVEVVDGPTTLVRAVQGRSMEVSAAGFWQVHPHAADAFAAAALDAVSPQAGETALDLYSGAGALTWALAGAVGPSGRVVAVESSRDAVADAVANLAERPWAEVRQGRVSAALLRDLDARPDVVVLDPPRSGAGRETMEAVLDSGARALAYVACDPAALARDVRTALDAGWRLGTVRAFDAFPMTHHVECVAQLLPSA